jgi:transcriptional regulator with XRE-family HTH domain
MAEAIVKLRTGFRESQQRFSERLNVSLATVGRWEIGDRQPSLRSLKELWHLAAERDLPGEIFADAFARGAGYELSSGPLGFDIRDRVSGIRLEVTHLAADDDLSAKSRERVNKIQTMLWELSRSVGELDLEPPFRSVVRIKGKNKQ